MDDFLLPDCLQKAILSKSYGNHISQPALTKMINKVYLGYQQQVSVIVEKAAEDPEDAINDFTEAQETASFFEPNERIALGGLFNILFSFSTLNGTRTVD